MTTEEPREEGMARLRRDRQGTVTLPEGTTEVGVCLSIIEEIFPTTPTTTTTTPTPFNRPAVTAGWVERDTHRSHRREGDMIPPYTTTTTPTSGDTKTRLRHPMEGVEVGEVEVGVVEGIKARRAFPVNTIPRAKVAATGTTALGLTI